MARPHIEFIHSQNLPWSPRPDGAEDKVLNADPDSTARTLLLRVPAGWSALRSAGESIAEELFVLDGDFAVDDLTFARHGYGFLPADYPWKGMRSPSGATLLVFRYAVGDPDAASGDAIVIDAPSMPWDTSLYDPALIHLRLARKVLRMGDNDSGRTYLLTGLPHGRPDVAGLQQEIHPHAEEMFMITGEMSAPEGIMTTGAYFYRPAGIVHGPHVSDFGFLMLMRNPGSNKVITHWQEERRPLPLDPPFAPVLPAGSPATLRQDRPARLDY